MSRSVWVLIDEELAQHLVAHNRNDAKQWIFHLIDTLKHEDVIKVMVVLWAIWTARRKAIHEGIFQSALSIYSSFTNYINELQLATDVKENAEKKKPIKQGKLRIAPKEGFMKLHVDGAQAKVARRGAWAALCRNAAGIYQGSSAVFMDGITDLPTLKAMALREGLSLALDMGVSRVEVSSGL
jgi:hypothetical protein